MIRYLSLNRNPFYAFLFSVAMLFAGLGTANAQCGTVSASPGFPATGCSGQFVAGQYIEVATASPANVLRWEYSTDGGATWNTIAGTVGVNPLTYTYLNTISGGNFYVGTPHGIGIREDDSAITRDTSRFVPHFFRPAP